ncbi:hypothetical protein ABFO76_03505 [Acinetobacter baumannii]
MDKKALQEQFESLPLMVAILNDSFIYVDQTNEYAHPNLEDNRVTLGYVNGAWYAFQHQQAKVEELETKLKQAYEDVDTFATAHEALEQRVDRDRSLIQFTQRANKDLIAERDKLQKQIDALEKSYFVLARIKSIASKNLLESILIKEVRQALKGEG